MVLLVSLSLSSCVKSNIEIDDSHPQNTEIKKETLYFRITWKAYSGRGEAIKKIVDSYNGLNENDYVIEVIDGDEDLPTIEALLSGSGATTDSSESMIEDASIYILPYRYVQYLGNQNMLNGK